MFEASCRDLGLPTLSKLLLIGADIIIQEEIYFRSRKISEDHRSCRVACLWGRVAGRAIYDDEHTQSRWRMPFSKVRKFGFTGVALLKTEWVRLHAD